MSAIVGINCKGELKIEVHHTNQTNKAKQTIYKLLRTLTL